MNYLIPGYIILCVIISVHSQDDETCDSSTVTDVKYNNIDIYSYCGGKKPCVVKCCGVNEVIHSDKRNRTCKNIELLKTELKNNLSHIPFDYLDLEIFQNDIYKGKIVSQMKFQDFTWILSKIYLNSTRKCAIATNGVVLLETGTLRKYYPNRYDYWAPIETPEFCVDMAVGRPDAQSPYKYKYITLVKFDDEGMLESKNIFTAIAMTISALFLLLVLIVYLLLHQLRNIQGMLLAAYVATLMCMYMLKAGELFYRIAEKNSNKAEFADCTVITQIIYYLILASFFWLKLMSFDIWWTFRGTRKLREIHRRGINVKFMIYASYAFGAPAAITVFAVVMDTQELPPHIVKPFFYKCFVTDSVFVYLYVPLMILTALNCLLFLMTIYNIWLIKRNMANFDKSTVRKTQKNQNRFWLYIKLSSIMGVSWILEIIQIRLKEDSIPVWVYILMNGYNVFIGVIIFFLFVFKTNIFLMLCKRFNIENRWTRAKNTVSSSARSDISKSGKNYSRAKSTTESDQEGSFIKKNEEGTKMSRFEPECTTLTDG